MTKLHPSLHSGTHFIVMGLGVSGMAAVRYGLACGAKVSVSDAGDLESLKQKLQSIPDSSSIKIEASGHTDEFLSQADIVFISPGVPVDKRIENLQNSGVRVVGELALAADLIDVPVVAVTGTNGKTTVTSLIGDLLEAGGKKVFVGGNIGTPVLDFLLSGECVDAVVLEVSSFQLECCGNFRPDIGILLNITPDHIDRHGNLNGYRDAKLKLFRNQTEGDIALLYGDDKFCSDAPLAGYGQRLLFGRQTGFDVILNKKHVSVCFDENIEDYNLQDTELNTDIGVLNAGPAIYAARKLGCSPDSIKQGLRNFKIGEHRLEYIRTLSGVDYYNDSKATNTGAVISGVQQFDQVVLIVGGRDKGDDYSLLRGVVSRHVKFLICIGEAASLIIEALGDLMVPFVEAGTLVEAVGFAQKISQPGQTVLLAPGCASFDMFKSYKDRGNQFRDAVLALAAES